MKKCSILHHMFFMVEAELYHNVHLQNSENICRLGLVGHGFLPFLKNMVTTQDQVDRHNNYLISRLVNNCH